MRQDIFSIARQTPIRYDPGMRFFTDTEPFTHWGRFYGIPCYYADLEKEGPTIAGTNVIWDWCVLHVAPLAQWAVETIRWALHGNNYEPGGFQLEIRGELSKKGSVA